MAMKEYDFQANLDAINELKEVDFFFKDKIEIDPEEYIVTHDVKKMIKSICDDECYKYKWFNWLNKFEAQVYLIENSYLHPNPNEKSAYNLAKHISWHGNYSFDFKDTKEKLLFDNNLDAIFSFCVEEVQLISGRNVSFFESIIKALKLGAIPYDYQDGKIVVCVPKESYVPVSKPLERILIDDSNQDDDFDMKNTRNDFKESFDSDAFHKANVGDVFSMGIIDGLDVFWKVLDIDNEDGSKLIISKDVIDVKSLIELDDIKPRGCVAWKDSKLRKWLNSKFMEVMIPDVIHSKIKKVFLSNKKFKHKNVNDNQDSDLNDTSDSIFCLSVEEAEKYFGSNQDRMAIATDYANSKVKCYAYRHFKNENTGGVKWWLRDSNFGGFRANYNVVDGDGSISDYQLWSSAEGVGVRPAMWIKL